MDAKWNEVFFVLRCNENKLLFYESAKVNNSEYVLRVLGHAWAGTMLQLDQANYYIVHII